MRFLDSKTARFLIGLAAAAALFLAGTFSGPYQAQIATLAAIYVILASSLNLLLGYSGLLSLGHQAFFGFGAYFSAYVTTEWGLPMPLGLVGSAVAGYLVAGSSARSPCACVQRSSSSRPLRSRRSAVR